ncbi:hypothetical protein GCM10027047_03170 [Rhodococcus aerolatus]
MTALVAVPALVGLGLLLLPALAPGRGERAALPVAVGTAAVTVGLAVWVVLTRPALVVRGLPGVPVVLTVDDLSATMVLTTTVAGLLVLLLAWGSPEEGRRRLGGLLLVFLAAVLVTVTAGTLLTLLVAWELMGACSYALVGHAWRERRRVAAGTTAFLTTRLADVGLYVAAGAVLAAGVPAVPLTGLDVLAGTGWGQVAVAGIVVAALGKAAQLPFSGWLSGAMLGPSPASALLHSAAMVAAGGYLLLRVAPLLEATGWALPVACVGALTAAVLGVVALVQTDLKQLLAASTCAQLGFVVLAAGTGAVAGGAAVLVAHAATKALLFGVAGTWLDALGTKDLDGLRGAGRARPVVGATAAVGALGLAGVPPLALWVGKDAALAEAPTLLHLAGLLAAALSAGYAARVLAVVLSPGRPVPDTEQEGTRTVRTPTTVALVVLAALAAGLGLLGLTPLRDALPGPWAQPSGLATSGVLAVVVDSAVLTLDRRRPRRRTACSGLTVDQTPDSSQVARYMRGAAREWVGTTALLTSVGAGVDALARVLARADDRATDGLLRAAGPGVLAAATTLDRRAEPAALRLATGTAAATRRLGALTRRLQTGQLHTYYAQAVVALVVLVVLLVAVR